MKIVFIGGRDIHKLGGIENYMYNLATQLVRMGHEPIVFCESDHNGEETVNGFRVIYRKGSTNPIFAKPLLGIKNTKEAIRTIPNIDLIHYNAWPPSIGGKYARKHNVKTLMQGHGFGWKSTKYPWILRQIIKYVTWRVVKRNENLIMCSHEQTDFFEHKFKVSAPTVPTATNLPDLVQQPISDILERFDLEANNYFLLLARLVQDKNPDYLIKAFSNIDNKGYKLVIAGSNPSQPKYVKRLHELARNNPNIVFTGAVYDADKDSLLRNAAAFCIPSTREGLAISLLEAMSYKLPIIASDIKANMDIVGKEGALWVKPESIEDLETALTTFISNPNILNAAIEQNYQTVVNNYTWEKVAEKYIEICTRLLK